MSEELQEFALKERKSGELLSDIIEEAEEISVEAFKKRLIKVLEPLSSRSLINIVKNTK